METRVRVDAYSILISGAEQIDLGGEFKYERAFDLSKIVGLQKEMPKNSTVVSSKEYIA